jgi:hypothetical protein
MEAVKGTATTTNRTTTMSSREFNQDTGKAKRAAKQGPVFITDRGKASHVLLTIEEYRRITGNGTNILEILAMPEGPDFEFDPPRLGDSFLKPADFS